MGVLTLKELKPLEEIGKCLGDLDESIKTLGPQLEAAANGLGKLDIDTLNRNAGDLSGKVFTLDGGVVAMNDRLDALNQQLGNLNTMLAGIVKFLTSLGPIFDILARLLEKANGPVETVVAVEDVVSKVLSAPLSILRIGIDSLNSGVNTLNLKIGK